MKPRILLFLSSVTAVHAGEPNLATSVSPAKESWITPTIDIRARYEFGDTDRLDTSHALTVRERFGLKTQPWNGFSAVIEGEFSQAVIDDYHGGAPLAHPAVAGNTVIADPETNELNQLFLQYAGFDTVVKVGRQRLIYDNAAFIGNVGWRQNEQTYDAISISNQSFSGLTLNYSYINRINRIFGSDAGGVLENVAAEVHLLNASYSCAEQFTLGAYAYLMDFEEIQGWDNDTFGITMKSSIGGFALSGEFAYQEDAGPLNNESALYAHATATKTIGSQSLTLGVEHLDAGFQSPLATLHAFNGFADVFVAGRTAGTHGGITDLYVSHTLPVFHGMKWTNVLHAYGDNGLSAGLGWEIDSVLIKKFSDHFTAIAKVAHFETESALPTTTRASLELNYTY